MAIFRVSKVVAALPTTLTADTLYIVRVGDGFDLYCTDMTGNIAHTLNSTGDALNSIIEIDGGSASTTYIPGVQELDGGDARSFGVFPAADTAETDSETIAFGNVLLNDENTGFSVLIVSAVNGLSGNVGQIVAGSNGGDFVINADGSWTFDPDGDFAALSGSDTATTSVTYHASNGGAEASATLTVTVSAASAPTDPLWAYVSLCINPTGVDGSTTITDAKGATLSIGPGLEIDTDVLGVPAILNAGANGITASNADVVPRGTEDFCIETWLYKTTAPSGYEMLIEAPVYGGLQVYFGQVQGQIRLGRYGTDYQLATPLSSMPIGSLKHLAFSRDGSTFRVFIDGVQVSSATANVSYATPTAQTIMLNLKALSSGIRVTRGHYRYNSNFTPVAPPFPEM